MWPRQNESTHRTRVRCGSQRTVIAAVHCRCSRLCACSGVITPLKDGHANSFAANFQRAMLGKIVASCRCLSSRELRIHQCKVLWTCRSYVSFGNLSWKCGAWPTKNSSFFRIRSTLAWQNQHACMCLAGQFDFWLWQDTNIGHLVQRINRG